MKTLGNAQTPTYTGPMDSEQRKDWDPRDFFRSCGAGSGSSCCASLIPLAVYVYSDRLTKSFQASTIIQVQSTATDAGLYLDEGAAEQPGEHRQDCRARRHERGGGSGRQAVGRTRGLASRAITAQDDDKTGFITITATAGSGERAAEIANTVARALRVTRGQAGVRRSTPPSRTSSRSSSSSAR